MPRGAKKSHKGMSRRFTAPEEIDRQINDPNYEWRSKKKDEEAAEKAEEESSEEETSSEEEGATGNDKHKGVQHLIEIENPNRVKPKMQKISQMSGQIKKPELSRKEKEAVQAERAKQDYERRHQAGLTEEAQADLARLALVRQQREEAAKKREDEKAAKEASKVSRQGDAFKKSERGGKTKSGK